jgi:hypothetical protein
MGSPCRLYMFRAVLYLILYQIEHFVRVKPLPWMTILEGFDHTHSQEEWDGKNFHVIYIQFTVFVMILNIKAIDSVVSIFSSNIEVPNLLHLGTWVCLSRACCSNKQE